ncbi:MAG TPA: RHS repeat-associated core domain-containing protein, partial [Nocardioides sp.]|nr:RHS repeat-associated core domain-containing protein [Nocardioides sp.]
FERPIFDTAILQAGVVRELSTSHAIVDGALVSTAVENGTHVVATATDVAGQPVWQQDAAGSVTHMHYDALNRLVRVDLPDGAQHTVSFDSYGRPAQVGRAGLASVRYTYDPTTGLPAMREVLTAAGDVERSVLWTRDAIGRVVSELHTQPATAAIRTFHHRWDGDLGDGTTVAGQRGHLTQVEGQGFLRRALYRRDGTLAESTLRLGTWRELQQQRTYYEDGSPKDLRWTVRDGAGTIRHAFTQTNVVDAYGRLAEIRLDGSPIATITYDPENRLARVNLTSGEAVAYHFDPVTGRPSGYWQDGGTWNGGVDWTMSPRGLVASETIAFGDQTTQRDYAYDPRGFLTASRDSTDDSTYAYDAAGLPTHTSDALGARDLVRAGTTLIAGDHLYRYDPLGRVAQRDDLHLAYGPTGQIDVARRGDRTWGYIYDEAGNRLYKHEHGQPTEAYLDGAYLDDSTFVVPVELAGRVIGVYQVSATGAELRLLPTDPRGTLLGDDGTPLLPTPFGTRATRPALARALDFAARGYDPDLGVVRFGVRDYDPYLGQFWTPDPQFLEAIDKVAASPVDGNLYTYARNNPLSLVDPSGLEPEKVDKTFDVKIVDGYLANEQRGPVTVQVVGFELKTSGLGVQAELTAAKVAISGKPFQDYVEVGVEATLGQVSGRLGLDGVEVDLVAYETKFQAGAGPVTVGASFGLMAGFRSQIKDWKISGEGKFGVGLEFEIDLKKVVELVNGDSVMPLVREYMEKQQLEADRARWAAALEATTGRLQAI